MPAKIYKVTLTTEERAELTALVSRGTGNARRLRRARILLLADENQPEGAWKDADIAKALSAHARTVERTREKCVELGIEAALNHTRPKKTRAKVRIPAKTITYSGPCRSLRPDDADHLFRLMAITRERDNAGSKMIPSAIICDQRGMNFSHRLSFQF